MTCDPLAYTGSGVDLGSLLTVAIACLAGGALLLLITRQRGGAVTMALVLLVSAAALGITAGTPTQAFAEDCPPVHTPPAATNSLTITQTSAIIGLAPGITPEAITGIVSNNGTDSTDIIAIDVQITGVITDPAAVPGGCDLSDYVLHNPRMPVDRTLLPGGSTAFHGASIGFSNKSTNQDACKGATIEPLYTANPN